MKKGDVIRLNAHLKDAAKTNFNYAEILEIRSDSNVLAYFLDDEEVKGRKITDPHPGHSYSFSLYDIFY